MKNKAILIAIVVLVMSLFAGVVAAQDDTPPTDRPMRGRGLLNEFVTIITDATGLTNGEILQQLNDGATLTEVIENAGGDVDAVISDVEAYLSTRVDELFNTQFDFAGRDFPIRDRIQNGVVGQVVTAITDATGLDTMELIEQVRGGATLADIITDNGGDVDTVVATVVSTVTDAVNERVANDQITQEQADTILANLEQRITDVINGEVPFPNRPNRGGRGNN